MFYVIGGLLVVLLASSVSSMLNGIGDPFSGLPGYSVPSLDTSGVSGLVYLVGGFGILAGVLIIAGGVLLESGNPSRRKAGGIIAVVMVFLGALPTVGGLFIGFVFGLIGGYLGLTYRSTRSNFTVGLGPVGSVTLGPQAGANPSADVPHGAGRGPLNYCIKCGSRLRDGAVFCGACGARVPD